MSIFDILDTTKLYSIKLLHTAARMPAAENLRAQWISLSKQETPFTSLRQILLEAGAKSKLNFLPLAGSPASVW